MIKGRCNCGGVAFAVKSVDPSVMTCHCIECRRMTGHFWAGTRVAITDVSFVSDRTLKWYNSSATARRGFCRECGSTLFFEPFGAGHYAIAAGVLDAPTGMTVGKHIFVNDKGDYYRMPSDAPLFDDYHTPHQPGDRNV